MKVNGCYVCLGVVILSILDAGLQLSVSLGRISRAHTGGRSTQRFLSLGGACLNFIAKRVRLSFSLVGFQVEFIYPLNTRSPLLVLVIV